MSTTIFHQVSLNFALSNTNLTPAPALNLLLEPARSVKFSDIVLQSLLLRLNRERVPTVADLGTALDIFDIWQ